MEFFKPLLAVAGKFESLTIKITPVGENVTVLFLPGVNNKDVNEKLIPVTMSGTAQELDDEFLSHIKQAIAKVNGLTTNIAEFEKKVDETEKELKEESSDSKKAKTVAKKSQVKKKPEPKKAAVKPAPKKKEVKEEKSEEEEEEASAQPGLEF